MNAIETISNTLVVIALLSSVSALFHFNWLKALTGVSIPITMFLENKRFLHAPRFVSIIVLFLCCVVCSVGAFLTTCETIYYYDGNTYIGETVGRCVQFQPTSKAGTTKYYSLPTELKRVYGLFGDTYILMNAYWPNGGYLKFTDEYERGGYILTQGVSSVVEAPDGTQYTAILTKQEAVHDKIPKATHKLNIFTWLNAFVAVQFLIGIIVSVGAKLNKKVQIVSRCVAVIENGAELNEVSLLAFLDTQFDAYALDYIDFFSGNLTKQDIINACVFLVCAMSEDRDMSIEDYLDYAEIPIKNALNLKNVAENKISSILLLGGIALLCYAAFDVYTVIVNGTVIAEWLAFSIISLSAIKIITVILAFARVYFARFLSAAYIIALFIFAIVSSYMNCNNGVSLAVDFAVSLTWLIYLCTSQKFKNYCKA